MRRLPAHGPLWIILVVSAAFPCQMAAGQTVVFEIDGAKKQPISPYIYGTNQPDWEGHSKYLTLTRWGGNRITAYNWETNASNAGSDWQHQNDDCLSKSPVPGEPVRKLVADAHAANAAVVVTIPLAGHVAADKAGGGDVNRTPDYLKTRFLPSLPRKNARFAFPPDLRDGRVFQDEFVWWLERTFPEARKDPRRTIFYALDNEPDLWASTHARIHPKKASYEEIVRLGAEYAAAIKTVAPKALVFGPVNYGWQGMVNFQDAPDAQGRDFLGFYLQQMRLAEQKARHRLLDVLDVHWYPEARGGNMRVSEDDARPEVAAARVQAPRSLWDPNYTEKSWITQWSTRGPIRLLPRLREKIEKNYPGTRLAITEYYYGGGADISGRWPRRTCWGSSAARGSSPRPCGTPAGPTTVSSTPPSPCIATTTARGRDFGETGLTARTSDVETNLGLRQPECPAPDRPGRDQQINSGDSRPDSPEQLPEDHPRRRLSLDENRRAASPDDNLSAVHSARLDCDLPAQSVSTLVLSPE